MSRAKYFFVFAVLSSMLLNAHQRSNILIHEATESDIPAALALDREIMMEYFKPLFMEHYSHLPLGKNPEYYLELDYQYDVRKFADCVNKIGCEQLLIACEGTTLAGFVSFHKVSDTSGEIELLLVGKEYRNQGLGKKLISAAIAAMEGINFCGLYVFSANMQALKFYHAYGFKDFGFGPKADQKIYPNIYYRDVLVYLGMTIPK